MAEDQRMILAGDIGGTHTRLAFFTMGEEGPHAIVEQAFSSREHANLETLLRSFVATHHLPVDRACFGVAGPIKQGRCEATNLAWVIDARRLADELHLETVALLNDLEANAYGLAMLAPEDFVALNNGTTEA